MTTAILSFHFPEDVQLDCPEADINHESRPLENPPPFATWARAYADAQNHPSEQIRLLELGRSIASWLNGRMHWLTRLLEAAHAPLILEIRVHGAEHQATLARDALEAPWELIARGGASSPHLALDDRIRMSPIRRLGVSGDERPAQPRMSVLFMAARPQDTATFDFEREEAAITAEIETAGAKLFVEDSGSPSGLVDAVNRATVHAVVDGCQRQPCSIDILHISCHATAGAAPALLLEDDRGGRAPTSARALTSQLAAHTPALAVISACSTTEDAEASRAVAADLCAAGWPAALGWSTAVDDGDAGWFAARLYRLLAQGQSLEDAVAQCRCDAAAATGPPRRAWHQARLFLGGAGGGPIVGGTAPCARAAIGHHVHAGRGDPFVGRRRALQRVLAALRSTSMLGAVIHGGGQLGKSSLARRAAHRRSDLRTVIVDAIHDASAIMTAIESTAPAASEILKLHRQRGPEGWDAETMQHAMRALLEGPLRVASSGAILLILDNFEQALEPPSPTQTLAQVRAELFPVIRALIRAFVGINTDSRLLFTSRHRFTVPDHHSNDLARLLWHEPLGAMPADEIASCVRASMEGGAPRSSVVANDPRLDDARALCRGNPGLLRSLLAIIAGAPARWPEVVAQLRAYHACAAVVDGSEIAAFFTGIALQRTIDELTPPERVLLRLLSAFQTRVPGEVAARLGVLASISDGAAAIDRMITLGVLDLTLDASMRPGSADQSAPHDHQVIVNALAAPLVRDDATQVALAAVHALRAAWDAAVIARGLRECLQLADLAERAREFSILAEVAGPVVRDRADTDPRAAYELASAVASREELWPDADEVRWMAEACRNAGKHDVAAALLRRAFDMGPPESPAQGRVLRARAALHRQQHEFSLARRDLEAARALADRQGDAQTRAVIAEEIAEITADGDAPGSSRRTPPVVVKIARLLALAVTVVVMVAVWAFTAQRGHQSAFVRLLASQRNALIVCLQQFHVNRGFCGANSARPDHSGTLRNSCRLDGELAPLGYTIKDVNDGGIVTYFPNKDVNDSGIVTDVDECACGLNEGVRDACVRYLDPP